MLGTSGTPPHRVLHGEGRDAAARPARSQQHAASPVTSCSSPACPQPTPRPGSAFPRRQPDLSRALAAARSETEAEGDREGALPAHPAPTAHRCTQPCRKNLLFHLKQLICPLLLPTLSACRVSVCSRDALGWRIWCSSVGFVLWFHAPPLSGSCQMNVPLTGCVTLAKQIHCRELGLVTQAAAGERDPSEADTGSRWQARPRQGAISKPGHRRGCPRIARAPQGCACRFRAGI